MAQCKIKGDFLKLAQSIRTIDQLFKEETTKAVNRNLTARNWLVGFYLFHYEQHGNDRAQYGARLLQNLASELKSPSLSYGNLKLYRQFYQEFQQLIVPIRDYIVSRNNIIDNLLPSIGQTLLGQFDEYSRTISVRTDLQSGRTEYKDLQSAWRIANAYTRFERIANPLERGYKKQYPPA